MLFDKIKSPRKKNENSLDKEIYTKFKLEIMISNFQKEEKRNTVTGLLLIVFNRGKEFKNYRQFEKSFTEITRRLVLKDPVILQQAICLILRIEAHPEPKLLVLTLK